jgi:hypothetical protein
MRRIPLLLVLVALPAFADGEMARLVAPAAGAELEAGSVASITWEGLALPEHADEWEAFLSLDGGRTWPLRITPHLDISIRFFEFRVPDFPSHDARVLLRFGDERREMEMVAPQSFAIAQGPFRAAPPPHLVLSRGERGVVAWVEGSRSGGDLREVVAVDPDAEIRGVRAAGHLVLPPGAPVSARQTLAPPAASPDPAPRPVFRTPERDGPRPAPVPVRLLIRRFNE